MQHIIARNLREEQPLLSVKLLERVVSFLNKSSLTLPAEMRVLDISSELSEVLLSERGSADFAEEVGDLLYSSLALCAELGIKGDLINVLAESGEQDVIRYAGALTKEILKGTDYGKRPAIWETTDLPVAAIRLAGSVIGFATHNGVEPESALVTVLLKYNARLDHTNSAGSGK